MGRLTGTHHRARSASLTPVDLPVLPPVAPMLAKSVKSVPAPDSVPGGLLYEPKWDGFRFS